MHEVRIDPDTRELHIGSLTLTDPDVLREAARWTGGTRGEVCTDPDVLASADLSAFVHEALGLGSRVIAMTAATGDSLAVQQAVKAASEQVAAAARQAAEDAKATAAEIIRTATEESRRATQAANSEMLSAVRNLVAGENPELQGRLTALLSEFGTKLDGLVTTGVAGAMEKSATAQEARHEELTKLVRDVQQEVAVTVASAAAADEIKAATTAKGLEFEVALHEVMHRIAAGAGAEYRETGDKAGKIPYNKKGDGVFVFGSGIKVVIEAHDGKSKDWGDYLAEAERNRGASASIGVVRKISENGGQMVRVLGDKRIVIAFDPETDDTEMLRTIVLVAKTIAIASADSFTGADVAAAASAIREAVAILANLEDASKAAAAMRRHIETIEKTVTKTTADTQRQLQAAINALAAPEDAEVVDEADEDADGDGGEGDGGEELDLGSDLDSAETDLLALGEVADPWARDFASDFAGDFAGDLGDNFEDDPRRTDVA